MSETWHNNFLDPTSAPDPDRTWLAGCSAAAMLATDRAASRAGPERLDKAGPVDVPVLYGEPEILGDATHVVRERFPHAHQVTLSGSGHLRWLQQPDTYRAAPRDSYAVVPMPV
jgi:hypothetical protein